MKFSIPLRISSVNVTITADWATFTEENLNGKLHFLCSVLFIARCNASNSFRSILNPMFDHPLTISTKLHHRCLEIPKIQLCPRESCFENSQTFVVKHEAFVKTKP